MRLRPILIAELNILDMTCPSRLKYVDIIKGLAAFMIVLYHFTEYGFVDFGFKTGEPYFPSLSKILLGICAAGVPLFFWVNGVTTIDKNYSLEKVLIKLLNIAKIYFFWGTLLFYLLSWTPPSLSNFGAAICRNVYYFWFFKTLAILCVVQFLFRLCNRSQFLLWIVWIGIFIYPFISNTVFDVIRYLHPETVYPSWTHTGFFTLYSLVYFFGYKIFKNGYPLGVNIAIIVCGIGLNAFVVLVNARAYNLLPDNVNSLFPSLGALMMTVGIYYIIRKFNSFSFSGAISWLGKNCLGIYIFHIPVIVLVRLFYDGHLSFIVAMILCVVITFFTAAINEVFVRIPLIRNTLTL